MIENIENQVGVGLIIVPIIVTFVWIMVRGTRTVALSFITTLCIIVGLVLIFRDRVTELTLGSSTIKVAAAQAVVDAKEIAAIKKRIANQSQTVDLVASQGTRALELSERANKQLDFVNDKFVAITRTIDDANSALDRLKLAADFTMIIMDAQNDNRAAFDKLKQISENKENPFSIQAEMAWHSIYESHTKPYFTPEDLTFREGVDPSMLTLLDIEREYNSAPIQIKPSLLGHISGRQDFRIAEKLQFFIDVIKSDQSLKAIEHAGRYFTSETKLNVRPLDLEYIVGWWDKHRNQFDGK